MRGLDSIYGRGNGSIFLDNVVCNGTEDTLLSCEHAGILNSNCDHSQDAAVKCGGKHNCKHSLSINRFNVLQSRALMAL